MQHRVRDLLMRQRTQLINALRAHMAELGIVAAQGREGIKELLTIFASEEDVRLPVNAHASLVVLMIGSIEKRIIVQHRSNETSKRLETIPGIGVIGATAIAATVVDPKAFPIGSRFGGLDRTCTARRFDRWQTERPRGVEARASATAEVSSAHSDPRKAANLIVDSPDSASVTGPDRCRLARLIAERLQGSVPRQTPRTPCRASESGGRSKTGQSSICCGPCW